MRYYPSVRLLYLGGALSVLALIGQFVPYLFGAVQAGCLVAFLLVVLDAILLYKAGGLLYCERSMAARFSNGDENPVSISLRNDFSLKLKVKILDQMPDQFQLRDFVLHSWLGAQASREINYTLKPNQRGVYSFGDLILLVSTEIGLIDRKLYASGKQEVKVYPSFLGLEQIELKAISDQISNTGIKRVRRIGQSTEFDTIKNYVVGDDPRHINWSSTASTGKMMVNQYVDERSQNVYCILDKSRIMKLPFEGLTLLDHSINAALALMTVALKKEDNVGLMAFEKQMETFVKAARGGRQSYRFMEALYHEKTTFDEPDFEELAVAVKRYINQRSLLLLFTNFESTSSLERQLPYLKEMSRKHLLLVIYFRNTEIDDMIEQDASTTRQIYDQIIARQMLMEKLTIRNLLTEAGILSLYTLPAKLSTSVVNRYIEIKASREI